jgi:hypothetical protein
MTVVTVKDLALLDPHAGFTLVKTVGSMKNLCYGYSWSIDFRRRQSRNLVLADIDVAGDLVHRLFINDRADIGFRGQAVALRKLVLQAFREFLGNLFATRREEACIAGPLVPKPPQHSTAFSMSHHHHDDGVFTAPISRLTIFSRSTALRCAAYPSNR